MASLDDAGSDCFVCKLGLIGPGHYVTCDFTYFMDLPIIDQEPNLARTLMLLIPMDYKIRYASQNDAQPILNTTGMPTGMVRSFQISAPNRTRIIIFPFLSSSKNVRFWGEKGIKIIISQF